MSAFCMVDNGFSAAETNPKMKGKIGFVRIFFQKRVESSFQLDESQKTFLQLETFQQHRSTNLGDRFLKVFPIGERVVVARENSHKSCSMVPVVDAVVFSPSCFREYGKDIFAVWRFLKEKFKKNIKTIGTESFKKSEPISNSLQKSESHLRKFIAHLNSTFSRKFLSNCLSAFLSGRKVRIIPENHEDLKEILRFLYLLAPHTTLTSSILVLYKRDRDEYSFGLLNSESGKSESRLLNFLKLSRSVTQPVINLEKMEVIGNKSLKSVDALVLEFLSEPWWSFSKLEHYRALSDMLERIGHHRGAFTVFKSSRKLERLHQTLIRLKRMEKLFNDDKDEFIEIIYTSFFN